MDFSTPPPLPEGAALFVGLIILAIFMLGALVGTGLVMLLS